MSNLLRQLASVSILNQNWPLYQRVLRQNQFECYAEVGIQRDWSAVPFMCGSVVLQCFDSFFSGFICEKSLVEILSLKLVFETSQLCVTIISDAKCSKIIYIVAFFIQIQI